MLSASARWRIVAWTAGTVLGALAIALLTIVVEPTVLRPLIRDIVQGRSGRAIEFSTLRIGLDGHFEPRLEFDDLMIANAPWAVSREPLIQAKRVGLDLTWPGLVSGLWVVRRLVLEDATMDLERDKEGRRNSRLSTAEGRGPARTRVLSVDARRSRLTILDAISGYEIRVVTAPLATPRVVAGLAALPLTRTLDFEGRRQGQVFSGHAEVSDLTTLQQTGERFALQGEMRIATARFTAVGAFTDLLTASAIDADVHLDADPLPALLAWMPPLPGIVADGHLLRDAQRWQLSRLRAKSRGSAIEGEFELRRPDDPASAPRVGARVRAARLDIDEWRAADSVRTARAVVRKAAGPASMPTDAARTDAPGAPSAPFDFRGLGRFDAAVELGIDELFAAGAVVARDARLTATLEQARLHVALPDSRIAGGQASGDLHLDAKALPASATLDAKLAGLRLDDLPPVWRTAVRQVQGGRVSATASVGVRGQSPGEWLGSASGSVRASLDGARISDRLEAKLGLDGLAFLRSLVSGADAVPLRCAEVAVDLQRGRGTVRRLALDTARTAVSGTGSIDFVGRTFDLVLAPSSHVGALFVLDRDIRIQGPFAKPHVSLQSGGARPAPVACPRG